MSLPRLAIITAIVWTMGALSVAVMFFFEDVESGVESFFRSAPPSLSAFTQFQRGMVQVGMVAIGVGGAIVWGAFGLPSLLALVTTWFFERQPREGCRSRP